MLSLEKIDQILINDEDKKLVRDGIHTGDPAVWDISEVKVLEDDSLFLVALANKSVEEAEELRKSVRDYVSTLDDKEILKELADQLTIIKTFLEAKGWKWEDLEKTETEKNAVIGSFKLRHFLSSKRRET